MTQYPVWKPTLLWHAKCLGICLAVCTAVYFAMVYMTEQLPVPYQKRQPSPEVTPWLGSDR